jgi:hypothetical protein
MAATAMYATAWSLTLAPIILFLPAVILAGMGPCSFAHPLVLVIALLLFVGLEIAALPQFVRAARRWEGSTGDDRHGDGCCVVGPQRGDGVLRRRRVLG